MPDQFDINWSKFTNAVNGKHYLKKNKGLINSESHFVEYTLNNFFIQIEVYIQLEPLKRTYSTFLERFTKVRLSSNQQTLQKFELRHKSFFNKFFFGNDKISSGMREFDSRYQIKMIPEGLVYLIFKSNALNFFIERKIMEGNLYSEARKTENIIELKFPEIIYLSKDIESLHEICLNITEVLSK